MEKNNIENLTVVSLNELIKLLNIENFSSISSKELLEKIVHLLKSDLTKNGTEITVTPTANNCSIINLHNNMLPLLIFKLLSFSLKETNNNKISISEYTENIKTILEFNMASSLSVSEIDELTKIARLCDNTQISVEFANLLCKKDSSRNNNISCKISISTIC